MRANYYILINVHNIQTLTFIQNINYTIKQSKSYTVIVTYEDAICFRIKYKKCNFTQIVYINKYRKNIYLRKKIGNPFMQNTSNRNQFCIILESSRTLANQFIQHFESIKSLLNWIIRLKSSPHTNFHSFESTWCEDQDAKILAESTTEKISNTSVP